MFVRKEEWKARDYGVDFKVDFDVLNCLVERVQGGCGFVKGFKTFASNKIWISPN